MGFEESKEIQTEEAAECTSIAYKVSMYKTRKTRFSLIYSPILSFTQSLIFCLNKRKGTNEAVHLLQKLMNVVAIS